MKIKVIQGNKTNNIYQKNKVIHGQDNLVEDKNNELSSKERQVEFSLLETDFLKNHAFRSFNY